MTCTCSSYNIARKNKVEDFPAHFSYSGVNKIPWWILFDRLLFFSLRRYGTMKQIIFTFYQSLFRTPRYSVDEFNDYRTGRSHSSIVLNFTQMNTVSSFLAWSLILYTRNMLVHMCVSHDTCVRVTLTQFLKHPTRM